MQCSIGVLTGPDDLSFDSFNGLYRLDDLTGLADLSFDVFNGLSDLDASIDVI